MACSDQDSGYAFSETTKAAGRWMKAVLQEDKRIIGSREGQPNPIVGQGEYVDSKH